MNQQNKNKNIRIKNNNIKILKKEKRKNLKPLVAKRDTVRHLWFGALVSAQ